MQASTRKKVLKSICRVLLTVSGIVLILACVIAQPTFRRNRRSEATVDAAQLKAHVVALSETFYPRSWNNTDNLNKCAEYITSHFTNAGASVESQVFEVYGKEYKNVIGRFGVGKGSKIIVGAHFDACGDTPGADDNASGIATLIELAHLLGENPPDKEVELVAYTLEEPPFFRSENMGSAVHAKSITNETIRGVIVLETMGYFSDERGSQSYPSLLLRLLYPSRGNFIGVVGAWDQGAWIKDVKAGMKGTSDLAVHSIRAPSFVPGVDFSDHINYWPYGINALMITDTAFYRNKAYHTREDTADRLDYDRMSKVTVAVFEAILTLDDD